MAPKICLPWIGFVYLIFLDKTPLVDNGSSGRRFGHMSGAHNSLTYRFPRLRYASPECERVVVDVFLGLINSAGLGSIWLELVVGKMGLT